MVPFLAVVRSPAANGVLTEAALKSLQVFLGQSLVGTKATASVISRLGSIGWLVLRSTGQGALMSYSGIVFACFAITVVSQLHPQ